MAYSPAPFDPLLSSSNRGVSEPTPIDHEEEDITPLPIPSSIALASTNHRQSPHVTPFEFDASARASPLTPPPPHPPPHPEHHLPSHRLPSGARRSLARIFPGFMGNHQAIARGGGDGAAAAPLLGHDEDGAVIPGPAMPPAAGGAHGFIALDIDDEKSASDYADPLGRWAHAMPEDVFVHIFSFLDSGSLGSVASVNHSWQNTVYDVSLWERLDLSPLFNRVDDNLFYLLISGRRFRELQELSLEGCSGLTIKSLDIILQYCPNLKKLLLTDCGPFASIPIYDLVKSLRHLKRLELYRATEDIALVPLLQQHNPQLDLGFFYLEYCAFNGLKVEGGLATCRHEDRFNAGACWGRVKGRCVFSNRDYHRGGNFPSEVLYSCEQHSREDLADSDFLQCEVCERLFRQPSMWTNLICRTCFDLENLTNKNNWTPLIPTAVRGFNFADVVGKTVRIADRKNLPTSLRSYGTVPCRLDYQLPAEHPYPSSSVPVSVFLDANGWRVDETVHNIKQHLRTAKNNQNTRALLVYDDDDNVEVLADRRVILDGREGEDYMRLTLQAWGQTLNILYPILIVMAIVMHFTYLFRLSLTTSYNGQDSYTAYLNDPQPASFSGELAIIIAGALLAFLVIVIFLIYRYRDLCERLFKQFLVLDILVILLFGGGAIIWLLTAEMSFTLDAFTFIALTWNFAFIGVVALYLPVPVRVHHFYLIILNSVMGIMLLATLSNWLIFAFVALAALVDLLSDLRPNVRLLSPFIIPANVQLLYDTPRILYNVGGLRLRAADLMWYGLMTGLLGGVSLAGSLVTVVCVLFAVGTCCFVLPFLGKRARPLPIAFAAVLVAVALTNSVVGQYITDFVVLGQLVSTVQ